MVFIADYGAGNLRSVKKAFDYLGIKASVSSNPADMAGCQKVVLPGVGAFGQAIDSLDASGFSDAIREHVDRGGHLLGHLPWYATDAFQQRRDGQPSGNGYGTGQSASVQERDRTKSPRSAGIPLP